MVVNIQWHPELEKREKNIKNVGEEFEKFGEELEKKGGEFEKLGEEIEKFGEEIEKKGEKMEKTIIGRDLQIVAEPITDDSEISKLGTLFRKMGINPVEVLRSAYLKEASKIVDAEQRNLSILRCLDKDQQKEVSDALINILNKKME